MTTPRRASTFVRLVTGALLGCAWVGGGFAQERAYPPKYSQRKPAWYDFTSWFDSSDDAKTEAKKPADKIPDTKRTLPTPTPVAPTPPVTPQPASNGVAWNWYGYGAPTPGANPLAPQGTYDAVPPNWHVNAGTTPGAIPLATLRVAAPFTEPPKQTSLTPPLLPPPVVAPEATPTLQPTPITPPVTPPPTLPAGRKPILPEGGSPYSLVKPPRELIESPVPKIAPDGPPLIVPIPPLTKPDNVDWRPARLALPTDGTPSEKPPEKPAEKPANIAETPAPTTPLATLRKPTVSEPEPTKTPEPAKTPVPEPRAPAPPPGIALPSTNPGTPDIPVAPAVGIRTPD